MSEIKICLHPGKIIKMKNRLALYITLIISVAAQLLALKYFRVFPDLALMIAVFSGMFFGPFEGVVVGLFSGFLRSCFSSGTMAVDMVTFSLSAYASSIFSLMFYKRNLLFHVVSVMASAFLVFFAQALYLRYLYGVDISLASVLTETRGQVFLSALTAPFIFPIWALILRVEE